MIHLTHDGWDGGTHNTALRIKCAQQSEERRRAYKYFNLAHYTAHLQYEMERMWEEELFEE